MIEAFALLSNCFCHSFRTFVPSKKIISYVYIRPIERAE